MASEDTKKLPAALIVNTRSRKGERLFEAAMAALQKASFNIVAIYPVRNPDDLIPTVERALNDGAELVILGSGDGTVSEVVDSLANHKAILGFLPLGTTNNFARTLDIPVDFDGAVETLINGKVTTVHLGMVNDDYFANVCAIGLSATIAATVPHHHKRWLGRAAYALTGLKAVLRQQPFRVQITDDTGRTKHTNAWQVVIANGRFHAGRALSDRARITDDSLTVYCIEGSSRFGLIRALVGYGLGNDHLLSNVTYTQTNYVTVVADPSQQAEIDGELKAETPLRASVAPSSLKIIVPQHFQN